ncbi:cytochrome P450 [Nocardia sp. NBC_01329]|uniref:cytochrome P450 n=1 Tax=Nocardia sp. NBC_01329 TaxID=2903594 RepID=UPI002E132FD4|nr:cytochrome P450 [Nocardia sp. NBC_01329]
MELSPHRPTLCPALDAYQPFDPAHLADPYPLWESAQREAPVFYVESAGFWAVTGYREVLQVTHDTDTFTSRDSLNFKPVPAQLRSRLPLGFPQGYPSLINTDPPDHSRLRRAANQAFTPGKVNLRVPEITQIADDLIDTFIARGRVDIVAHFAVPLPVRVISRIIGVEPHAYADFQRWSDDAFLMSNPVLPDADLLRCATSMAELAEYLQARVAERREEPGDDLLSDLLSKEGETLAVEQIISIAAQTLIGGNVTTTDLIGNALLVLLSDPARWDSVVAAPDTIPQVIEEVLRVKSAVRGLFRTTTRATELGGVQIPARATVWVVFAAANHDLSVFPRPGVFDPDRANLNSHLSFGRGAHFCIGAPLARAEAKIALERLAARLPGLALVEQQQLTYPASPISQGVDRLELTWN